MKFVEEIVVDEFLPTVRSMLAAELRERGLTQSEVAEVLGISQSAVSKYAHGDVARKERFASDERVQSLTETLGEGLATGDVTQVQALVEIEVLIRELEGGGDLLARRHEEVMPGLAEYGGDFHIHDPDSELRTSERVLSSLRRGLRSLENASGFASLIPNVGSNLVACLPDAEDVDDVAGVPGRIVDVKGRAEIPGGPEFGVSAHVASVLLAARRHGSEATAAGNIRYDEEIVSRLEDADHVAVEFDAEVELNAAIGEALRDAPEATVVYQTGAYGIEPIVYVLGPGPEAVADAIRRLV